MKAEKTPANANSAAAAPPPSTPDPPSSPQKKRVRNRSKTAVAIPGGPGPVSAAESASVRIDELVKGIEARAASLLEAQRGKPGRWEYFAALADLEERLRRVLP